MAFTPCFSYLAWADLRLERLLELQTIILIAHGQKTWSKIFILSAAGFFIIGPLMKEGRREVNFTLKSSISILVQTVKSLIRFFTVFMIVDL